MEWIEFLDFYFVKGKKGSKACLADVKCRFFAQYFHQEVWRFKDSEEDVLLLIGRNNLYDRIITDNDYLELKPLSKITNEDAVEAIKIFKVYRSRDGSFITEHCPVENIKNIFLDIPIWRLDVADFLRSKGYAVPFMEYSVEDLVKMGWVRLV